MRIITIEHVLIVPGSAPVSLYYILKPTRFSSYVPFMNLLVKDWVFRAVLDYYAQNMYADLTLEEYLGKLEC